MLKAISQPRIAKLIPFSFANLPAVRYAEAGMQLAAIAVLGATVLVESAIYTRATMASPYRAHWDPALPGHIVKAGHVWPLPIGAALVSLTLLQVLLLLRLGRESGDKVPKAVLVCAFAVAGILALQGLRATYLTSNDAYAYIGYAKLTSTESPYAPPDRALPGQFAVINHIWHRPLVPAAYGPLDLALYRAVLHPLPTLRAALLGARLLGLASVALLALLVWGLTRRARLVLLVALNPALYQQFVVNAHNDLIAVDLILAGVLLARRSAVAGAILAGASGLVKISFLLFAPAFAPRRATRAQRIAIYAGGVALVVAVSAAVCGPHYVQAMTHVAKAYSSQTTLKDELGQGLHYAIALFGLCAVVLAAFGGPTPWSFAWAIAALAVQMFPWYLVWGIPYALRERASARLFLAVLPLPSLALSYTFPASGSLFLLVLFGVMLYEATRMLGRTRPAMRWTAAVTSP